jgi:hypothetical protein
MTTLQSNVPKPQPTEAERLRRNALRITTLVFVIVTAADIFFFRSAIQRNDWRLYGQAGLMPAAGVSVIVSLALIGRGRTSQGIWLMLFGLLTALVINNGLLLTGRGLLMGLGATIVLILIVNHTLPAPQVRWAVLASIGGGLATLLLDLFGPSYRLAPRGNQVYLIGMAALMGRLPWPSPSGCVVR